MTRRIAFVCNNLNIGGPQKGLIGLLDQLDPEQFTCTVISLQPGGTLRPYIEERFRVLDVPSFELSLQINRKAVGRDVLTLLRHRAFLSALMYATAVLCAVAGLPVNPWRQRAWYFGRHKIARLGEHFDAAFAVSSGLSTYYVVDGLNAPRKYHWVIGDYSLTRIARSVDLHYFAQLTGAMAVSDECSALFTELFPELETPPPRPLRFPVPWRYYGQNAGPGSPEFDGHDGPKILTVTRLEKGKGLLLALAAARTLADLGVKFRWLILGDGSQRPLIEAELKSLSLGSSVQLCGFKNNVSEYLERCDVFVLPSSSEGRSIAVDEAMAFGVVPVLTDFRTARSQVTDGVTGLISGFTGSELADCIMGALEPSVRARIQANLKTPHDDDPTPALLELSS